MLQQVFVSYPRAHSLIQTYVEAVGIDGTDSNVRGTSGYEALRTLAKEFMLWSRAEASFCRADFVKKSYKGDTTATYISDAVRKMGVDLCNGLILSGPRVPSPNSQVGPEAMAL